MNKIKYMVAAAMVAVVANNAQAWEGIIGETCRGVGYVLFGDRAYDGYNRQYVCNNNNYYYGGGYYNVPNYQVVGYRDACVTQYYRSGADLIDNAMAYQQNMIRDCQAIQVRVAGVLPQDAVVHQRAAAAQVVQPAAVLAQDAYNGAGRKVWVAEHVEYRDGPYGVEQVKVPAHYEYQ